MLAVKRRAGTGRSGGPWRAAGANAAWAWKPAVIHAALQRAKPGDFVVYLDSSRFFPRGVTHSFVPLCDWLTVGWCRLTRSNPS